ncbi:MAG: adenylate/guanylate cyclase domain-containing protein [Propionibacteriales bacterium]|nr:adenylate/guanylate cyclase domain-containing protein [Propionibacteriales bacterium]
MRAFAQFAMYAATGAAGCAWIAVAFGALGDLRLLALALISVQIAVQLRGASVARADPTARQLRFYCALVNLTGGTLALFITLPLHDYAVTAACVTMAAYFGLTMFRLSPLAALGAVGPYTLGAAIVPVVWYTTGDLDGGQLAIGIFLPVTALLTGMMVNLALEWVTRQTYVDHLTIESQQDALFEERTNLARFMSPEIAETVHRSGVPASTHCEIYSLTAVSIDLRGFTRFTQRHGAERMVEVLQDYYTAVIEAAEEYGATVKDFAGDGALVLVGAPFPRADHTRAGLRLARDMLIRVREVTARWETADTPLGAGIGIASGECAVGALGLPSSQLEYAAVGTAVNLSSRLCDIAKDGQILMAAGTARALEEAPGWRREIVTLSGVPESVEVTIEDTLHPHEMIPADRPASSTSIPSQSRPDREAPVALPE